MENPELRPLTMLRNVATGLASRRVRHGAAPDAPASAGCREQHTTSVTMMFALERDRIIMTHIRHGVLRTQRANHRARGRVAEASQTIGMPGGCGPVVVARVL